MNFFDLVATLRTYCDDNNIIFVYGKQELQEVHLQQKVVSNDLVADQLVLFAGFTSQPVIMGKVVEVSYNGFLMLGRKSEDDTSADLDETQELKYDRRLNYLQTQLSVIIGSVMCNNDLEITNTLDFEEVINQFDENLDCIQTPIIFKH